MGKFPDEEEGVNWTKLLLGRAVKCIFEKVINKETGEEDGDKIAWIGSAVPVRPAGLSKPKLPSDEKVIQVDENGDKLSPDDEIPF